MTDTEGTHLTEFEVARFADIVGREWPKADLVETARREKSSALPAQWTGSAPGHVTVFRPRRPTALTAFAGLVMLGATVAATRHLGPAAFHATVDHTLSAAARSDAARTLAVIGVAAGVGVVASLTLCGVWLVGWARYCLRRSAWRTTLSGTAHPIERHVRPPNLTTAVAWIGLLVGVTFIAGWWVPNQLDLLASVQSPAVERHLTEQMILGGIVWCGLVVACLAGLALWTCREGRHQIRVTANRARSSE